MDPLPISLFFALLAFTRPLHYHLFRSPALLYGTGEPSSVGRLSILFGALTLVMFVTWLSITLLMFCGAGVLLNVCEIAVIWLGLLLFASAMSCILSWRIKEWLSCHGISIRIFGLVLVVCGGIVAICGSVAGAFSHPAVFSVVGGLIMTSGLTSRLLTASQRLSIRTHQTGARSASSDDSPRVVVLVFDELEQRLLFDDRPEGLALPNVDSFFKKSLILENAIPPSRCTEISIPAMLLGRLVYETRPHKRDELMLQFSPDGVSTPLSAETTLLHDAKLMGLRVGANIGYHPISEVFPGVCDAFSTQEAPNTELGVNGRNWFHSVRLQVRSIIETPTYSLFKDTLYGRHSVARYERSLQAAQQLVRDTSLDLCFIHLPVPHPPFIYDQKAMKVTARGSRDRSYQDNLALVDVTLGTLLRVLSTERPAIIILTSDHWWRGSSGRDFRVPFAVWNSEWKDGSSPYARRCNTVFLRSFVVALLKRKINSQEEIIDWLHAHSSDLDPVKV